MYTQVPLRIFLLVGILLSTIISGCSSEEQPSSTLESEYLHTASIAKTVLQPSYVLPHKYIGRIRSKQQSNLTFEFSGKIAEILVESGEKVQKGQLLASLDDTLIGIQLNEIRSQIKTIEERINLNKKQLARVNSLKEQGYSSLQQFDELSSEKKVLMATKEQLTASLNKVKYQLSRSHLYAPFDGTIIQRNINIGEYTQGYAFSIVKDQDAEIIVNIPQENVKQLRLNQPMTVSVNQREINVTLQAIGSHIHPVNQTIELRLAFTQPVTFNNGTLAYLHINKTIYKPGYWLPLTALTDGVRGQWNIFMASPLTNNTYEIQAQTVKVEHTTSSQAYISGLETSEITFIKDGLHRLVQRQHVKAKNIMVYNPIIKTGK